jgi:hypothetical protein
MDQISIVRTERELIPVVYSGVEACVRYRLGDYIVLLIATVTRQPVSRVCAPIRLAGRAVAWLRAVRK